MIDEIIARLSNEIKIVFGEADSWFNADEILLSHRPKNSGWSIREILEHISITNHFLLNLIKKGTSKAIERAHLGNYSELLNDYVLDWERLKLIGEHHSFNGTGLNI